MIRAGASIRPPEVMSSKPALRNCAQVVRSELPSDVFAPRLTELWRVAVHGTLSIGCYFVIARGGWPAWIAPIFLGHSLACLAFVAHDVSHGSVVSGKVCKTLFETVLWGVNFFPPTLWHWLHNVCHHSNFNTLNDTDRAFLREEDSAALRAVVRYLSPMQGSLGLANPLYLLHFTFYLVRNLFAAAVNRPTAVCPAFPTIPLRARRRIFIEMLCIALAYGLLLVLLGGTPRIVMQAFVIPLLISSAVLMAFIFTNHLTDPLTATPDPFVGATSLRVPAWVDFLYCNFSLHVEHHLFPSLNSKYYPLVTASLERNWPGMRQHLGFVEAWRKLSRSTAFHTSLVR